MSNKAIFMDRDDTLIEDPGYLSDPSQVKLLPGVPRALIQLKDMGYKLIVATNQSAVARGIITEKVLRQIHDRLEHLLARQNARLDAIYYCPYHPEGSVAKFRRDSDCRKPNPGMLLTAADELDIDLAESWMIGNAGHDIEAGLRAGCKTILIDVPSRQRQVRPDDPTAHYQAVNIIEAANIIKKYNRRPEDSAAPEPQSPDETTPEPEPDDPAIRNAEPLTTEPQAIPNHPESRIDQPAMSRQTQPLATAPADPAPEQTHPADQTQQHQPQQSEYHENSRPDSAAETTQQLLTKILDQLKAAQRSDMFSEFSTWRFMAGAVLGLVVLCMLITVYLLMSPNRKDTSVLIGLGFATVLQLMSLTFLVMQDRK
ncbi:MAG: HAD-IIIA family hydrolase [Sedimentisphaerales bacterium]|nr:HAD-IIIA family hydrolase [Sedimentisphaerales bacterium]